MLPNITSAKKDVRVSKKRQARNKSIQSQCKTNITKAEGFIFSGDIESAEAAAAGAVRSLDKAAEKGIIHPNNAARRKSRLMKKLNEAKSSSVEKDSTQEE